jgi:hypothetical protein
MKLRGRAIEDLASDLGQRFLAASKMCAIAQPQTIPVSDLQLGKKIHGSFGSLWHF